MAIHDRNPPLTPRQRRMARLVRALAYATLIGCSLGLWGMLTSNAWRDDADTTPDVERRPIAVGLGPSSGRR
jgi:hypothetical protein